MDYLENELSLGVYRLYLVVVKGDIISSKGFQFRVVD